MSRYEDSLSWKLLVSYCGSLHSESFVALVNHYNNHFEIGQEKNEQLLTNGVLENDLECIKKFSQQLQHQQTKYYERLQQDLSWLDAENNHHIIFISNEQYPKLLKQIHKPPLLLYLKGDMDILSLPQLAIVGSRNASSSGLTIAKNFSQYLAKMGITITSGMAFGIDTASHEGALEVNGTTIAVMGTGLNTIYPNSNYDLAKNISRTGLLISEFPLDAPPRRENFPQRNRIISGLSMGVIVIEAGLQSGSLITARYALEQNREVFTIPGSIHNPASKGCHQLLRQGAKLVESVDDIIEEIAPLIQYQIQSVEQCTRDKEKNDNASLSEKENKILNLIGYEPIAIDYLFETANETIQELNVLLQSLEIKNYIHSPMSGYVMRCKS